MATVTPLADRDSLQRGVTERVSGALTTTTDVIRSAAIFPR